MAFVVLGSFLMIMVANPVMIVFFIPLVMAIIIVIKIGYPSSRLHYGKYIASKGPILSHINTIFQGLFALRSL